MIKAFTSTVANIITKEIQKGKNPGGGGKVEWDVTSCRIKDI